MRKNFSHVLLIVALMFAISGCGGGGGGGTNNDSTTNTTTTDTTPTDTTPTKRGWELIHAKPDSETASSVLDLNDGNILVIGTISYIHDAKYSDIYALKVDSKGNVLWNKQYGGTDAEQGISILRISDGSYTIIGSTSDPAGSYTGAYLLNIDQDGNVLSEKTAITDGYKTLSDGRQTSDGGYIIVGSKNTDLYLLKLKNNGDIEWEKTIGSGHGNSIDITSTGFIITGHRGYSLYLAKTDFYGAVQWEKTVSVRTGRYVRQTSDGGYIVTGDAGGPATTKDVYLLKTDALGNILWEKTFDGLDDDRGYSVQQTTDGGYIIVGSYGFYYEPTPYGDIFAGPMLYLIKTSMNGDLTWEKHYGDKSSGSYVRQTTDGYIITGYIYSDANYHDIYVIKTDNNGDIN